MKNSKKGLILASAVLLAGTAAAVSGVTYAIFSQNSETKVETATGSINVSTNVTKDDTNTSLAYGSVTINNGKVTLGNIVPGDYVTLNVSYENLSSIGVKARQYIKYDTTNALMNAFEFEVNGVTLDCVDESNLNKQVSAWSDEIKALEGNPSSFTVKITLPEDTDSSVMGLTGEFSVGIDVVQGNATVKDVKKYSDSTELYSAIKTTLATEDSGTFYLADGQFTINGSATTLTDKNITLIGSGASTVYNASQDNRSFDGSNLTIKNMSLVLPAENDQITTNKYYGLHAKNLTVENCTIKELWMIAADEKTTFNNCTFNAEGKYNIWTYQSKEYVFNNCVFNSKQSAFINVYKVQSTIDLTKVTVNNCSFLGGRTDDEAKAAVYVKNFNSIGYTVVINNSTILLSDDTTTKSGTLYSAKVDSTTDTTSTTITVDGTKVNY